MSLSLFCSRPLFCLQQSFVMIVRRCKNNDNNALGGTSFFLPAFFAFPFFTLPLCHQAIIVNALIALVMKPQIRNRSRPTQDRGQAQGSRSRRARRLSPRCFPGGVVCVSEDPEEVSLTRKPSQHLLSRERKVGFHKSNGIVLSLFLYCPQRLRKLQNSGINRRCCLSLHFACIDVSVPVKVIMLSRTKQVVNYFLKKVRFPP